MWVIRWLSTSSLFFTALVLRRFFLPAGAGATIVAS
jgi:hypothetical protein